MTFDLILKGFAVILLFVVVFGFINERFFKLPTEIWLMISALGCGLIIWLLIATGVIDISTIESTRKVYFSLDDYLVDGVLCFMLFSGSCHIHIREIRRNTKLTVILSVLSTLFSAIVFGALIYLLFSALHIEIDFMICFLLGCIVSPTDPIAAMSILRKAGLPKDTGIVIEAEALFNDGVGVALFICISGLIEGSSGSAGFLAVMAKELFGAIAVGLIVSWLLFFMFKSTQNSARRVFISVLSVSASYVICELCGFSGAIASVCCGIYYATRMEKLEAAEPEKFREYRSFWDIIDALLNGILYVMLGLSFYSVLKAPYIVVMFIGAIIINLIARGAGVFSATLFTKKLPDGAKRSAFTGLLTWSGLRGGLCLALAMSTASFLPEETYYAVVGCAYMIVFFTTVVQGLSVGRVYKKLYA